MHLRPSENPTAVRPAPARRRILAAFAAGVLLATLSPSAAHAADQVLVELPLTSAHDIVAIQNRVFVSGGRSAADIVVTDRNGSVVRTIGGLPGASDLALSRDRRTLYVALPEARAVVAVDTRSLRQTARYEVGDCPRSLAPAGRYLYFGYGCEGEHRGNIGSIALRGPAGILRGLLASDLSEFPMLSTGPDPTVLLAATNRPVVQVHRAARDSTLTLLRQADSTVIGSNLNDIAITADGSRFLTACGWPYMVQEWSIDQIDVPEQRYPTGMYPRAVEVSPDGRYVAGGVLGLHEPDVHLFDNGTISLASFELDEDLVIGGLAWSADSRRLYALSHDGYADPPAKVRLHVLPVPAS